MFLEHGVRSGLVVRSFYVGSFIRSIECLVVLSFGVVLEHQEL